MQQQYYEGFRQIFESKQSHRNWTQNATPLIAMAIKQDMSLDNRNHNSPRINEVAVVFQSSEALRILNETY